MNTPTTPSGPSGSGRPPGYAVRGWLERLSPRQRQYALLAAILGGGIGLLWMIFSFAGIDTKPHGGRAAQPRPGDVTNIGVMPPGGQVNPVDQWVGTAGRKLAQYETEREEQSRVNKDRQAFESKTLQRFAELEKRLTSTQQAAASPPPAPTAPPPPPPAPAAPTAMPPATGLPPAPPSSSVGAMPSGSPTFQGMAAAAPPAPVISRVTLAERARPGATGSGDGSHKAEGVGQASNAPKTVSTFLPVSFTRGILLGGLDAPTGGQSQANPHPVLIRLSDNSVLPNQFRGEYRECFVIAAGYGDISSERAYTHTPFTAKVEAMMRSIAEKITTRTAIPNNSTEVGFVNQTTEPVYKMLSIGTSIPGSGLADSLIGQYRDVIAADYAYVFLERNLRLGMAALDKNYTLQQTQRDQANQIRQRAQAMLMQLSQEKNLLYQKVGSFRAVASHLEQLERQLRSSMPQHVMDMLGQQAAYLSQ